MKTLSILTLALLAISAVPSEGQEHKVLMILKDSPSLDLELALQREVGVMKNMLERSGFQVVTASPSADPLSVGSTALTPELTLDQVRLSDFEGIILPSMAVEDETPIPGLAALLREAMATGKPVAAQTGSVVTLARAGILKGRRFAYPGVWVDAVPEFAEAVHAGEALVEDGDLITSAVCPYAARILEAEDGTQALTGALIKRLW